MKLEIKFRSEGGYEYETLRTEWDRNDDGDTSAMVLIEDEESDGDGYYEVNVYKDHDTGEIAQCGYVNRFASTEDEDPVEVIRDVEIRYEQHDFDEVLRVANETLQPFGKRIVVDYDGEGYWAIGSTDMDGSNAEYYAEGDFEHEVARDINECLVHVLARVKNPELWQKGQDTMQQVRNLWKGLTATEHVDLMVEFYCDLMDADKDRFLSGTGNG